MFFSPVSQKHPTTIDYTEKIEHLYQNNTVTNSKIYPTKKKSSSNEVHSLYIWDFDDVNSLFCQTPTETERLSHQHVWHINVTRSKSDKTIISISIN